MTHVPYDELNLIQDVNERKRRLDQIISSCAHDDPIFLSDALVRIHSGGGGAQELFIALDAQEKAFRSPSQKPMSWHIQVLCDEWGNKPNPGDKVVKINKKPLKNPDGTPLKPGTLSAAKALGTYERDFEERFEYTIDSKGCIECYFSDAVHYLNLWGIHAKTGVSLTSKPEMSTEPVLVDKRNPNGARLHVWYRRFKEMDKDDYKKLPKIKKNDESKRGIVQ